MNKTAGSTVKSALSAVFCCKISILKKWRNLRFH
nr:MAG TPA: hypothetical protein [Caudoviricetes sp.]